MKFQRIVSLLFAFLYFFSCSSSKFEFHSTEISLEDFLKNDLQNGKFEIVWLAQKNSFLGTYIQELSRQIIGIDNKKSRIPSVTLSHSEVMLGLFYKSENGSFPLGFFSSNIKREGILPMDFLKNGLILKSERIGGFQGRVFLTAEKKAEDIGIEIRVSDSMNRPGEIIWWFPLEREKWNEFILGRKFFPYLSFKEKVFNTEIKIKFCRTRYGQRIMEERKILEEDYTSLSQAEDKIKNLIKELKFNLKI
ncbi:MAG: hypothetical protein ACUVUG_08165 [Candidatus Aminicenantia bacterium]